MSDDQLSLPVDPDEPEPAESGEETADGSDDYDPEAGWGIPY